MQSPLARRLLEGDHVYRRRNCRALHVFPPIPRDIVGPNAMTTLTSTRMIQPTATHRSEKFLAVLASLGRLLATGSGQRQMLADVLKELDRELGMIRGTLMLVSLDGSELFIEAAPDIPSPWDPGLRYRRGEGIIGTVVQTGRPAIIPRVSEEPRFPNRIHQRLTDESEEVSFLCVPMRLESEVSARSPSILPARIAGTAARSGAVLEIVASMIAFDVNSRRQGEALRGSSWRRRTSACGSPCRSSSGRRTSSATRTPCARCT